MDQYIFNFICMTLLTFVTANIVYKAGKEIANNEKFTSTQKTRKIIVLIVLLLFLIVVYLSKVYIPADVHETIKVQEVIPQTKEYVRYDNEYVSYYDDSELERIHLNDKTKILLGNNKKYKTIEVDKKVYTNLFGEILKEDILEIDLK